MIAWLDRRRAFRPAIPGLDDDHVSRALAATAILMAGLFVVTSPAWVIDSRTIDAASVWTKPQKFNVSGFVHFMTLAWIAQQLPRAVRAGPTLSIFAYLAVGSMLLENVYISIQAARGRRSHFNFETDLEASIYALMGVGALLLVIVAIVLAVQILRKGDRERPGLRLGSIIGLSVGAVATIGFAGYMSTSGSHYVGGATDGGASVPFFGWSREIGDLRPAHFVALHMMQTLPIIGWLTDRVGGPSRLIVLSAGAAQLALAAFLFAQALDGRPFWPA
ncbi:MAG: hypothetical protein GC152_05490 [Alphaproteobacteria bacterium]|nr:hypothetical protein [Alphaproteobacteria bacterium]